MRSAKAVALGKCRARRRTFERNETSDATKDPRLSVSSVSSTTASDSSDAPLLASASTLSEEQVFGSGCGFWFLEGIAIKTTLSNMHPAPSKVKACGISLKNMICAK